MEIIISKEPDNIIVDEMLENEIEQAVKTIGSLYDVADCEVSITLTDNATIHKLNKQYRNIDRATDVLSFAFRESDEPQIIFDDDSHESNIENVLGDIIISVERAAEQAEEYGHSLKREIVFLTVHGMLHLLGYDHIEEADRLEMEQEQQFIMEKLGISRD